MAGDTPCTVLKVQGKNFLGENCGKSPALAHPWLCTAAPWQDKNLCGGNCTVLGMHPGHLLSTELPSSCYQPSETTAGRWAVLLQNLTLLPTLETAHSEERHRHLPHDETNPEGTRLLSRTGCLLPQTASPICLWEAAGRIPGLTAPCICLTLTQPKKNSRSWNQCQNLP